MATLELELQLLGFTSWVGLVVGREALATPLISLAPSIPQYDNKASDLTKAGMEDGVSKTGCFLLFLSSGVMERPYVQVGGCNRDIFAASRTICLTCTFCLTCGCMLSV